MTFANVAFHAGGTAGNATACPAKVVAAPTSNPIQESRDADSSPLSHLDSVNFGKHLRNIVRAGRLKFAGLL